MKWLSFWKLYDVCHNLLFEGEYLGGQKNGKGKEYNYEVKLIFEGEYYKDKRKSGKKYYYKGKIKFEVEYLFDKKWNGKGKEYFNGKLIFEGE